ncbi:GntR family transcriptional regulator [Actinomadura gamaensis]|uniref:GntR family transcriptional regulator n=1 Tax=Actinomadura gamaensis TaxID=1763541 RepID=A0ABV9U8Z6_9ACTN
MDARLRARDGRWSGVVAGSAVEEITDRIALQIASGRLKPGDTLPSIRKLAEEHGVSPSRIQQVIGRLQYAGFVEARHGAGVIVRDIRLYGGVETWRYLFRLSSNLPELTVRNVKEILETLQLFYQAALMKLAEDPSAFDPAPARRAVNQLQLLAGTGPARAADVHHSVLHILRTIHASLGGGIILGLLNTMGGTLADVPDVLEPLYSDPAEHLLFWDQVVTAMETGDVELGRQTLALLEDWHAQVLDRLRTRLTTPSVGP